MAQPGRARVAALRALVRVDQDRAYAPLALAGAFSTMALERRDRSLATELVYGVLRSQGRLDYYLRRFAKRPVEKLSPWSRAALRLAFYQILFLDSIPAPVACSESVMLVKEKEPWAAGFVNGVCRNFVRTWREVPLPDCETDPISFLSVVHSHPDWLVSRWHSRWGFERADALCDSNNRPAPVTIRVNLTKTTVDELTQRLKSAGVEVERGRLSPVALRLRSAGAVERLPGFEEGEFQVQDESSQLVAWAVDPRPGDRIADVCAGPGGKSTHIAELASLRSSGERGGTLISVDVHRHKSELVRSNAQRLGLDEQIRTLTADARALAQEYEGYFDKVLVDAPCSGSGVLRRRPDLRWQRREEDLRQLVELQREILAEAARIVAPGGTLVYSTCSLEEEENMGNVEWFLRRFPHFRAVQVTPTLPEPAASRLLGDAPWIEILPDEYETDGFFIFRAVHKG